jgi:hypothetical protein
MKQGPNKIVAGTRRWGCWMDGPATGRPGACRSHSEALADPTRSIRILSEHCQHATRDGKQRGVAIGKSDELEPERQAVLWPYPEAPWPAGGSAYRGAPAAPACGRQGGPLARNGPAGIANSPIVTAQGHRAGSPADAPETSPAMENARSPDRRFQPRPGAILGRSNSLWPVPALPAVPRDLRRMGQRGRPLARTLVLGSPTQTAGRFSCASPWVSPGVCAGLPAAKRRRCVRPRCRSRRHHAPCAGRGLDRAAGWPDRRDRHRGFSALRTCSNRPGHQSALAERAVRRHGMVLLPLLSLSQSFVRDINAGRDLQ